MNKQKHFLRRLGRLLAPRRGKEGSSLGMVVIIGAVLVIWVMSLMPLMTATGTAAIGMQSSLDDYLTSRSAIEFAKSELTYQVREDIPRTFAVIENGGDFSVVNKWSSAGTVTTEYMQYVANDAGRNDHLDVPQDNAMGKKVGAICAVMPNATDPAKYDIVITTYAKGEKELTFTATYTLAGNLLIYPESYKQHQALPLSDFVLVDGKLGANEVWKSTIENKEDKDFTETLLPWLASPDADYANAGEYPAVFKTTALTPEGGGVIGDPKVEVFTDQEWIMPHWNSNRNTEGAVWVDTTGTTAVPKMYLNGSAVDVTDYCTVYFNGVAGNTLPTRAGTYKITVDTIGTLTEDPNDADGTTVDNCYVLPAKGIEVGTYVVTATTEKHGMPSASITAVSYDSTARNFDVTIGYASGTRFGYTTNADGSDVTWMDGSDSLKLNDLPAVSVDPETGEETDLTYYFYCYRPASIDGEGNVTNASNVQYVGMVYPFKAVEKLEHGEEYLVMGSYNAYGSTAYYCLDMSGSEPAVSPFPGSAQYKGKLNDGVLLAVPDSELLVTMLKTEPNNDRSNVWQFTRGNVNASGVYTAQKYLELTITVQNNNGGGMKPPGGGSGGSTVTLGVKIGTSSADNNKLNIKFDESAAEASKSISYKNGWYTQYKTGYLKITNSVKCEESSGDIWFVKVPTPGATTVQIPSYTVTEGSYTIGVNDSNNTASGLKAMIPHSISKLYANGTEVTGALGVGVYDLMGAIRVDGVMVYVSLGDLTVTRADQSKTPNVSLRQDGDDEQVITVTGSNWNSKDGIRYFGYKADGDADYHWFATTAESYEFRLNFGTYTFAVWEGCTNSYNASGIGTDSLTINAQRVELDEESRSDFWYTVKNVDGEMVVTWYKLPAGITPSKITMVYGTPVGESEISWSYDYGPGVRYYGIIVLGSDYKDLNSVLKLDVPLDHTASMLKAKSMYFMGETNSIDTKDNTVYLYTDLLVIRNPIKGDGQVLVYPYTTGEEVQGDTLVFFVEDQDPFVGKNFYRIPAGTDLNQVTAAQAVQFQSACGATVVNGTEYIYPEAVKVYFRQKLYPVINLDIAYATEEQLMRIISGEKMGWTTNGDFKSGGDSGWNYEYVVCAYVSQISTNVNYNANRIMIAAKDQYLEVPKNVTLTTRYLSLDSSVIKQVGSADFVVYNLAEDPDFLEAIAQALKFEVEISKTMQVDYERHTTILGNNGENRMKPQICRYDDEFHLFTEAANCMELMVTYTNTEIENYFSGVLGTTVKTTDRYVTITNASGGDGKIEVESILGSAKMYMYANYIYIDKSIDKISFNSMISLTSSDLLINSQESGYTTNNEYLSLFISHSAESRNGTLIYLADNVTFSYKKNLFQTATVNLPKGFYFLAASSNGTSITKLATDSSTKVDTSELGKYSVYVDPDTGELNNAYVDTGLFDNSSEGRGGFSGGNVQ